MTEPRPTRRVLPPGSRHHQPWCAVFRWERCDCDDDKRAPPARRKRPSAGGAAKHDEEEMV